MLKALRFHRGGPPPSAEQNDGHSRAPVVLLALTGIRGVAAWWVVLYHFREVIPPFDRVGGRGLIDQGYLAVDLFFVLSGFIISMNYLSDFAVFSWRLYFRFLIFRIGRIYPLHLFMLIVFLLNPLTIITMSRAQDLGDRYSPAYFGLSLLLVQNWGFSDVLAWNLPAWSISTEWFVYLVFPAVAMLQRAASTQWRAVVGIVISLSILSAVTTTFGDEIPTSGLPRCLLEFFAGSCVYTLWRHNGWDHLYRAQIAVAASVGLITAAICYPISQFPMAALAWCALIHGLANQRSPVAKLFSNRRVFLIGEYSYSTYLVHYFVRDWVKFLLVGTGVDWRLQLGAYVLVTAAGSFVLYHLVEVPGRRFVRELVVRSGIGVPRVVLKASGL
jgi:peptidoglycan/LPS O-acetylase OafA/YrhL